MISNENYEKCGKPLPGGFGGFCTLIKDHGPPEAPLCGTYAPKESEGRLASAARHVAAEGPQVIRHHRKGLGGRMTRHILRSILRELKAIRLNGEPHATEALGRRRPSHRKERHVLSAYDAAWALRIDLNDLVELGEEARKILDRERRETEEDGRRRGREREGMTGRLIRREDRDR